LVLQGNSGLATTNWLGVTNKPLLTNGIMQVVAPQRLAGSLFYRLALP
jgi:hypothetical protein